MRSRWAAALVPPLVLGLLVSVALVPLFDPRLPHSADGKLHLFRSVSLDWLIQHGWLWPRYSPDMVYGYGYPVFNYYAPLTYYGVVGLHQMGFEMLTALRLAFGLALVVGAGGVFRLVANYGGALAGYVAAVTFGLAPYVLFNNLTRGALPEAWGLALTPWLWWLVQQAWRQPRARILFGLGLAYAALFLTHNLSALLGTPLLALIFLAEGFGPLQHNLRAGLRHAGVILLALAGGLTLAAFFWLPAVLETGYVQISQLVTPASLDYHHYFLNWRDWLTWPRTFDPRLEAPPIPVTLGLPQTLLALAGALTLARGRDPAGRARGWLFGLGLLGVLGLTSTLSLPLWESIAGLRFIQFPWRFLGPATLLAAILAGAAAHALVARSARWGPGVAVGVIPLLILYALTWTYVNYYPFQAHPGLADLYTYEFESGAIGTTSTGEFLPTAVTELPPPESLRARYAAQPVIDRLDETRLPAEVQVVTTHSMLLSATTTFRAPVAFVATYLWFYFPGWQATVDGQPTTLQVTKPYGLIAIPVPAGQHTVQVNFASTPLREAAGLLSGLGLVGLLWVSFYGARYSQFATGAVTVTSVPIKILLGLALIGLLAGGWRWWFAERDNPFRQSRYDGQTIAGVASTRDVNFGDVLNLIGVEYPDTVLADEAISLQLYWRPYGELPLDYSVAAHLVDETGQRFGQADSQHPGQWPTSRWHPDNYAHDIHALWPEAGTPPGTYRLVIGVYPERGGAGVNVYNEWHIPHGNTLDLGTITLLPARRPPTLADLDPARALNVSFGEVSLLGVTLPITTASPGDTLPLTLYWQAVAHPPTSDLSLTATLEYADGTSLPIGNLAPIRPDYPPRMWPPAYGLRAPHRLVLPASVLNGPAQLVLHTATYSVTLGQLTLTVPERSFDIPPLENPRPTNFGVGIQLLGYHLPPATAAGQPLVVYWQARALMSQRYMVFVHLLDENNQILAQRDTFPLNGARPTSGWLPGEILRDEYVLEWPSTGPRATYQIALGFYDPLTNERLAVTTPNGEPLGDRLVIPLPFIQP